MLLLSKHKLNIGNAKELKQVIKTMDDLQKLLDLDYTALALVKDPLKSKNKTVDTKASLPVIISDFKHEFLMRE